MRDHTRIDKMLEKLRIAWHAHPDMRLGQIVANSNTSDAPVFYAEDDQLDFSWCERQKPSVDHF